MQILVNTNIDFMGKRKVAFFISMALLIISIASLIVQGGPKLSIDFTGGTFAQLGFTPAVTTEELRTALVGAGISAEIQAVTGTNEYNIRMKNEEVEAAYELIRGDGSPVDAGVVVGHHVRQARPDLQVEVLRQETVGPKIGGELQGKAIQSVLLALVLMLAYIAFRFKGIFYALGAVAALFHDVIIVLGIFSVLQMEVSLTILAALLTIAGYSINDTIVVFDRIREMLKLMRKTSMENVINVSINKTLSRTALTSLTTLFAVGSLYFFGGIVIHDFAFAVLCGVVVGTYSSIFVASSVVLTLHEWKQKRDHGAAAAKPAKAATAKV